MAGKQIYEVYLTINKSPDLVIFTTQNTTFEKERELIAKTEYKCPPKDNYDSLKEENKAMKSFTSNNKFPEKFMDTIYYKYVKDLYENITNDKKIKEIGLKWVKNYGDNHLHKLYYWIVNLSPLSRYKFTSSYAASALNDGFDGIGFWQA